MAVQLVDSTSIARAASKMARIAAYVLLATLEILVPTAYVTRSRVCMVERAALICEAQWSAAVPARGKVRHAV